MNEKSAPHILVPTDFSEHSEHALRYAASLGERFGATLHLLHVLTLHGLEGPLEADQIPDLDPFLEAADKAARSQLDAGARHGGEAEARVVKAVARGVNAWEQILEYARQESIDMIVMAMHSGSGLARYLIGSVTERVLRFAPCPVLVVEKGDRDFVDPETMAVRLEKVVVADDLSDKTPAALGYAVEWLEPYRPELHLIHAVEVEVPMPYVMAGVTSVFTLDPELEDRLKKMVDERLSDVIPLGWKKVIELREGPAYKVVTAHAQAIEADLLVVAGETRIDLGERVLGGTVERIARHAPCPMLVV
jgi:nucleotide-binding universal stress UspA family protein